MTHNDIVEKIEKLWPKDKFFKFLPKSPYGVMPFDILMAANNWTFAIEVKRHGKDALKKHQIYYLKQFEKSSIYNRSFVIEGAFDNKPNTYMEIQTLDKELVFRGNYRDITSYLFNYKGDTND